MRGPFSLCCSTIRLIPRRPFFRPWVDSFASALVWIWLVGLPLQLWNLDSVALIAQAFAKVLTIDNQSFRFARGRYIRVCVELDFARPLHQRVWTGKPDNEYFQPVSYENLPSLCYSCCMIGHHKVDCPAKNSVAVVSNEKLSDDSETMVLDSSDNVVHSSVISDLNVSSSSRFPLSTSSEKVKNLPLEPLCGPWV
ncbi:hypothetical protein Cni_G01958 [Canna indica]|uniref:Zinc knuckle CX2CX4HX4C domain-containing protein n=1 Tax=Canna indica TaxID=4628 RepID=A0AAQ3PZE7_9LILI|nr:hypothetical protein Cni_G01958 [Canna indica]